MSNLSELPNTPQEYIEKLPCGVPLAMANLPAGRFVMGALPREREQDADEIPKHLVCLNAFALGRYPITQSQWRVVAEELEQIDYKLDPYKSQFKGFGHPVEGVSWLEAREFCQRLSIYTRRTYNLPSESQWEYACRAGTATHFHCGDRLTAEMANYDCEGYYGSGPKNKYRLGTTPVGIFGVANAFGLYDMHGNVAEWCEDHYHQSYEGAPTDGTAWVDDIPSDQGNRVLRGGSWSVLQWYCRSAARFELEPNNSYLGFTGFRVTCSVTSLF